MNNKGAITIGFILGISILSGLFGIGIRRIYKHHKSPSITQQTTETKESIKEPKRVPSGRKL